MCVTRMNITCWNIFYAYMYLFSLYVSSHRNQIFFTSAYSFFFVLYHFLNITKGNIFTRGRVMGLDSIDTALFRNLSILYFYNFDFASLSCTESYHRLSIDAVTSSNFGGNSRRTSLSRNTIWKYGFGMLSREHRLIAHRPGGKHYPEQGESIRKLDKIVTRYKY